MGAPQQNSVAKQHTANGDKETANSIVTSISATPVTTTRKVFVAGPDDPLVEYGVARANTAPSNEKPEGTTEGSWAQKHKDHTVLEQHCVYFDTDGDGVIWPLDTYRGCRKWGWNPILSAIVMFIIHFGLSYPTVSGILPDPFFRLWVKRMYKNKHGSSSQTYDHEGRYRPQNFEDIFAKYDLDGKKGLTLYDIFHFWNGQRFAFDFWGMSATGFEWIATYLLIWPEDGVMKKEDIRGIYDGSIFFRKAEEFERRQQRQQMRSTKQR